MKYLWSIAPFQREVAKDWAQRLNIPPLLAQCLLNRGVQQPGVAHDFLQPRLKHLADPFLIPNMSAAVDRLFQAREKREPLVIFGDYDVDGVTSTALLLEVFKCLGWTATSYLPHRLEEGYGLSRDGVENCLRKHPVTLLLAVDCGSTALDTITWLKERGVDVVVLDHHQVSHPLPPAVAVVNPQIRKHSQLPESTQARNDMSPAAQFSELCSVGLAFKLAHALVKRARESHLAGAEDFDLRPLLDLVALGTIADIVPLTGENRILVSAGLTWLGTTRRLGLTALKQLAQCPAVMGVRDVAYQLAPRLNASGRLETAEDSLRLILATALPEALGLAESLDRHNRDRQDIERRILEEALVSILARFDPAKDFVIVVGQESWHLGVVGVVAARVLQRFYRPTIVVGGDGQYWRGSGRSIPGFDLAAALRQCSDLLVRHGGHAMAAGVTLYPEKLDAFRERLNQLAREALEGDQLRPPLRLDAEVALAELSLECISALDQLEPVGQANPPVQLCARGVIQQRPARRLGGGQQHVKMWVGNHNEGIETLWWGAGDSPLPSGPFDLAFTPQINEYNGRRSVQLKLIDWQDTAPGS